MRIGNSNYYFGVPSSGRRFHSGGRNTLEDLLTGHYKNSYGVEGMCVTGRSDYKKIIPVSQEMKQHVLEDVKRSYYKYNGMSGDNEAEWDAYYRKNNEYYKTLKKEDRLSACWTLNQLHLEISGKVTSALKEKIPGWSAGKSIPAGVLDEIFADESITSLAEGKKTRGTGKSTFQASTGNYFNKLKRKYPGVNVTAVDFNSGRQEDAYMLGCRGYNNLAVSPGILAKMANDPGAAAKYEKVFREMSGNAARVEKFAQETGDEILSAGAVIDKNGKVSYWMAGRSRDKVENPGTAYKEKVQKQIKEKWEKKKAKEVLEEKRLKKADRMEKLLKKAGVDLKI